MAKAGDWLMREEEEKEEMRKEEEKEEGFLSPVMERVKIEEDGKEAMLDMVKVFREGVKRREERDLNWGAEKVGDGKLP